MKKACAEQKGVKNAMAMDYQLAWKTRSLLGEGIWWDERRECLFWVDILKNELHCLKDGEDRLVKTFADSVGFCAPCTDSRLVVGCGRELLLFDPDSGAAEVIAHVDDDLPENRFNDAKCTPDGKLLAGTMNRALDYDEVEDANTGRVYLIEYGKEPKQLFEGMTVPNGIAFSADGKTVYHTDTYTQKIFAYDYDGAAGTLTNPRAVVSIPVETGSPDGMNIGADDSLFIAHWGGGALRRFDSATGRELDCLTLPAKHVTCCCFGGRALDELYVTTSSIDAPEDEYPLAGSIFVSKCGVRGRPADRFQV